MVYKHCYQYARSTTPVSLYPAVRSHLHYFMRNESAKIYRFTTPISQVIAPVVIMPTTQEMDLLEARNSRRPEQMTLFVEMLAMSHPRDLRRKPVRRRTALRQNPWFRLLRIPKTRYSSRQLEPPCGISDSASFSGDLITFIS